MRTTVTLEPDVAAAVEEFRRAEHVGVSAAINSLIRRNLQARSHGAPFVQRTSPGHARIDLTDVADVLDQLDGDRPPAGGAAPSEGTGADSPHTR